MSERVLTQPEPSENPSPDWTYVLTLARREFEAAKALQPKLKDIEEYVYEAVMEAVYGKEFWPWNNERLNAREGY